MNFNETYTKYWASAVNKSVDGTIIAGVNEAKFFLQYLNVKKEDRILDLGCSFGRMYHALSTYSDWVSGVEPDMYAVEKARLLAYREVRQGYAEQTGFGESCFDIVFCWAVFDVVDQKKGLLEINRVLRMGGKLLLTGKNNNYYEDDVLAHRAEKNAFLKGFPNKFTDLSMLLENFEQLGFKLDKLLIFPRRGDCGLLNFIDQGNGFHDAYIGCEYLIICHKIGESKPVGLSGLSLEQPFSKTANRIAEKAGFSSPKEFFEATGFD